jgi:triacylglycerol lipase
VLPHALPVRTSLTSVALLAFLASASACASPTDSVDAGHVDAPRVVDAGPMTDAPFDPALDAFMPDARTPIADAGQDAPLDAPRRGAPYPIVLAHGFFGFDDFAGIGFVRYFFNVRDDLNAHGEMQVYTPAVDPFNDSETRGRQLLAHIERILAETGAARVNIIAHSQGGLDARVVANLRPDLIASITTISTPHRGSRASDVLLRVIADDRLRDLVDALVRVIGAPIYTADGAETSVFTALRQFSSAGIATFNAAHADEPGITYFSIAGRSANRYALSECIFSGRPDFITRWDVNLDPLEPLLAIPGAIVDNGVVLPTPNDGLVSIESARWGRFLGCIPADHLDEIGHLVGDRAGLLNDFDHLAFYRDLVGFLRAQGL